MSIRERARRTSVEALNKLLDKLKLVVFHYRYVGSHSFSFTHRDKGCLAVIGYGTHTTEGNRHWPKVRRHFTAQVTWYKVFRSVYKGIPQNRVETYSRKVGVWIPCTKASPVKN